MIPRGIGFVLLVLGTLTACTKPFSFRTESAQTVKIDELPADFKMPAKVWEIVEKDPEQKPGAEVVSPGIFYASIQVFLTEKNDHVLKSPAYVIDLPRGGGSIDLSNYTTADAGSFFVGFQLPEEFKEGKNFKALYVSQGRKRKLDNRVYGSGCSQYFDITKKFTEMMKTEGIMANTTRQRHVTLLAGHYIFSIIKDTQIFITQVTITDSKNKNLLCEAI
ncbi:MAG: hypothetical protein H7326_02185 [Bdellovibrionaceae bacterium]|nr:hypothetical protein [Pseudobdellovibrionaceae bacterium]